jgi:FecR-like protein
MECSEALDLLYSAFDGQITPTQQALLDGHRRVCFACATSLIKAERFQELIRHVPQLSVPRGLEQRIINRVTQRATAGAPAGAKVRSIAGAAGQYWRAMAATGGVLAAAYGLFFVLQDPLSALLTHRPKDETVTAMVSGQLQDLAPNNKQTEVDGSSTPLSSGETLTNYTTRSATVAFSPHLAVTIGSATVVHVNKLHVGGDGALDTVDVHVDRGTFGVTEDLHHGDSPIYVATNQATMVPTGTTFTVRESKNVTHLGVVKGSVAVYMPGRTFNVIAGQTVQISQGGVLREIITKAKRPAVTAPVKPVSPAN